MRSNTICGQYDEKIIENGKNQIILKNKIIYSLACSSASGIGEAVADENTTFIGYMDDFALGMDLDSQTTIFRDKRAKLFLDPSNLIVQSLLKGNSAKEAVSKAKQLMEINISKLKTDTSPDAKDYLPYLFNNYIILDILGNESAKIA